MNKNIIQVLTASLGAAGFGMLFNVHGKKLLWIAGGGGLGWLVYLLVIAAGGGDIMAAFFAAAFVGVYAESMARIRHCPVTGYIQVALLPLVPGAGVYYAMRYCVNGETELFLSTLLHTFGVAAAISVGAMLASSVFRSLWPYVQRGRGN